MEEKLEKMEEKTMKDAAAEGITARLSSLENLYFPRTVQSSASSSEQRKSILLELLRRDPAVFLDYEVDWHLKNLRKKISPTSEELKSRSVALRNRRLAYLNKLVLEGQYFSEDAMRDREPYLHHEYVGKFQDMMGRNMARPGERWSEIALGIWVFGSVPGRNRTVSVLLVPKSWNYLRIEMFRFGFGSEPFEFDSVRLRTDNHGS